MGLNAVETASPELLALIARMRWPVPAVKWWVGQGLALSLLSPEQQATTEAALMRTLEDSRFETEAVEVLFVFWLAKTRDPAYVCPANLSMHVRARSPLSDVLLKCLFGPDIELGQYLAPLSTFPPGAAAPNDFLAAEGRTFPPVLRSNLQFIEDRTELPLQTQFGFEWQMSLARVPDHRQRIDHFLELPTDQQTGQFFTEQSARARSAFVRTLAVAGKFGHVPAAVLERFALSTLPLDPTLAWLQPQPPVAGLALCQPDTPVGDIAAHIASVLACVSEAGTVGALSWTAEFGGNVLLDIAATLWSGPTLDGPAQMPLEDAAQPYVGMLAGEGLASNARCEFSHEGAESTNPGGFRPLAGFVNPTRFGYMQAEVVTRGIFAPVPEDGSQEVAVLPTGCTLSFVSGGVDIASFGYWNISWRPSHPRSSKPRCGTYLLLRQAPLRMRAFYVWKCTRISAKDGHGASEQSDSHGVIALAAVRPNS